MQTDTEYTIQIKYKETILSNHLEMRIQFTLAFMTAQRSFMSTAWFNAKDKVSKKTREIFK